MLLCAFDVMAIRKPKRSARRGGGFLTVVAFVLALVIFIAALASALLIVIDAVPSAGSVVAEESSVTVKIASIFEFTVPYVGAFVRVLQSAIIIKALVGAVLVLTLVLLIALPCRRKAARELINEEDGSGYFSVSQDDDIDLGGAELADVSELADESELPVFASATQETLESGERAEEEKEKEPQGSGRQSDDKPLEPQEAEPIDEENGAEPEQDSPKVPETEIRTAEPLLVPTENEPDEAEDVAKSSSEEDNMCGEQATEPEEEAPIAEPENKNEELEEEKDRTESVEEAFVPVEEEELNPVEPDGEREDIHAGPVEAAEQLTEPETPATACVAEPAAENKSEPETESLEERPEANREEAPVAEPVPESSEEAAEPAAEETVIEEKPAAGKGPELEEKTEETVEKVEETAFAPTADESERLESSARDVLSALASTKTERDGGRSEAVFDFSSIVYKPRTVYKKPVRKIAGKMEVKPEPEKKAEAKTEEKTELKERRPKAQGNASAMFSSYLSSKSEDERKQLQSSLDRIIVNKKEK